MREFLKISFCLLFIILFCSQSVNASNCDGFTCSGESDAIKKAYFGGGCNSGAIVTGSCSDTITLSATDIVNTGSTSKFYIDLNSSDTYQVDIVPPTTDDANKACIGFAGSYDAKNENYSYSVTNKSNLSIFFMPYAKYSTDGCGDSYSDVKLTYAVTIHRVSEEETTACEKLANSFPSEKQEFVKTACVKLNPDCTTEESKSYYSQLYACCDGDTGDCLNKGWGIFGIPNYMKMCMNSSVCDDTKLEDDGLYHSRTLGMDDVVCDPNVPWDDIKACSDVKFGGGGDSGDPIAIDPGIINLTPDQLENINPLRDSSVFKEDRSPANVINQALNRVIFPLAGSILFLLLVYGGFQIISASLSGKQNYIDIGKQRITAAIIGFILLFVSYWLWRLVMLVLGIGT